MGSAQRRTVELPSGGQRFCPLAANSSAHRSVGQWRHPLSGGGLGEADAVTGGHDDVGVVQQSVHPLGCHRPRIADRDVFEAILSAVIVLACLDGTPPQGSPSASTSLGMKSLTTRDF